MLYHVHDFQRAVMEPWHWWAQANAVAFGNPFSPASYAPQANKLAASFELMLRLSKTYSRPPFEIPHVEVNGRTVEVVEEMLLDKPFCKLLHFKKA